MTDAAIGRKSNVGRVPDPPSMLPGPAQWGKARRFGVFAPENTARFIAKRVGGKANGGANDVVA